MNLLGLISGASNVRGGQNPPFTPEDFRKIYPQFWDSEGKALVPDEVLDMYVKFAHASVQESYYGDAWRVCMSWFIAHFLTLYMMSMVDDELGDSARDVVAAGQAKGLASSKSVDGVSIQYDFTTAMQDLEGWAAFKLTEYGTLFASFAKTLTMGGFYIY